MIQHFVFIVTKNTELSHNLHTDTTSEVSSIPPDTSRQCPDIVFEPELEDIFFQK